MNLKTNMVKKIFLLFTFTLLFVFTPAALAVSKGGSCTSTDSLPNHGCDNGLSCQVDLTSDPSGSSFSCQEDQFGQIQAPKELKGLLQADPSGAGGLGVFLSNLIKLIYAMASVVFVLMLVWGAWDWLTSEGDKEKVQSAQKKIMNAIIGVILFAIAFAVIQVLGAFTGFKFFEGQKSSTSSLPIFKSIT